jgi:hypothetical protein
MVEGTYFIYGLKQTAMEKQKQALFLSLILVNHFYKW